MSVVKVLLDFQDLKEHLVKEVIQAFQGLQDLLGKLDLLVQKVMLALLVLLGQKDLPVQ